MSKSEFAYMLVRFSGIILLGWSALLLFDLVINLMILSAGPPLGTNAAPILFGGIIKFAAFLVVGLYLVKDGRFIASVIEGRSDDGID